MIQAKYVKHTGLQKATEPKTWYIQVAVVNRVILQAFKVAYIQVYASWLGNQCIKECTNCIAIGHYFTTTLHKMLYMLHACNIHVCLHVGKYACHLSTC